MKRNRNKIRRFFTAAVSIVAAFLFNISAYAQNIWHVDASVTECDGLGTSWPTAIRYLQDALSEVDPGDEIWVAAGTYFVDQDCANPDGTGDRVSTFQLVKGVRLLGGFDGTETLPEERDPLTNITILSGAMAQGANPAVCHDTNGCDSSQICDSPIPSSLDGCCCCRVCSLPGQFCCELGWDTTCDELAAGVCGGAYHVVTAGAEITDPFTTIIDGFTITDGTATGPEVVGGGMLISGAPAVIRCIFTNNNAGDVDGAATIDRRFTLRRM